MPLVCLLCPLSCPCPLLPSLLTSLSLPVLSGPSFAPMPSSSYRRGENYVVLVCLCLRYFAEHWSFYKTLLHDLSQLHTSVTNSSQSYFKVWVLWDEDPVTMAPVVPHWAQVQLQGYHSRTLINIRGQQLRDKSAVGTKSSCSKTAHHVCWKACAHSVHILIFRKQQ